jgi:hypothetical protein
MEFNNRSTPIEQCKTLENTTHLFLQIIYSPHHRINKSISKALELLRRPNFEFDLGFINSTHRNCFAFKSKFFFLNIR